MNLQLDHFSDVQKYLKPIEGDLSGVRFSQTNSNLLFCRSTPVEHGSHNVSRWMTWLSISLKNAAACDKWYQLQNHFITESLNANGAWEKPFVGHPRACHTQCRTNKKSPPKRKFIFAQRCMAFNLRVRAQARRNQPRVAVWLGVCCVGRVSSTQFHFSPRGGRSQTCSQKETLRFLFCRIQFLSCLQT